jgi:hypothetical protein
MPDFESGAFNRALPPLRYLTCFVSITYWTMSQCPLRLECAGVRCGVPFVSGVDEAIYSRCLVLGSEMGVAHYHLQRPVPKQLCHRAQIHSGHNQSTGKSMPVAMPGIPFDLRLRECGGKPAT